jgi:DNA-binding GntR family transcriptional regulator
MDDRGRIHVPLVQRDDIEDFFYCRTALETAAVARAAERVGPEIYPQLERIVKTAEEAVDKGNSSKVLHQNWVFHRQIVRASGNRCLLDLLEYVWNRILIIRASISREQEMGRELVTEHYAIAEAIRKSDADRAVVAVRNHLGLAAERYLVKLENSSLEE